MLLQFRRMEAEPSLSPGILLSEFAMREEGTGSISLIRVFHQFAFRKFPAKTGRFFVTVGITNLRGAIKILDATCRIEVAGTGHVISSNSGRLEIPEQAPPFDPNFVLDLPFPLAGVVFSQPGRYDIQILVDNEVIGTRAIEVVQFNTPTTTE